MTDFKITPFPRRPAPEQPAPPVLPIGNEMSATAESQKVIVITDGACSGNPGPGGWGVIIRRGQEVIELHGGERDTTNNRMEITAVIEALKAIEPSDVEIISDSEYVINTMTKAGSGKRIPTFGRILTQRCACTGSHGSGYAVTMGMTITSVPTNWRG